MCGIGGLILLANTSHPAITADKKTAALSALDHALAHRGPDGAGSFHLSLPSPNPQASLHISLLHRRLSIIDLAGGRQPMLATHPRDPQNFVAVVFNGCIYNHRQLRDDLTAQGARFTTSHSDTEVIAQGLLLRGPHFIHALDGMFAIAALFSQSAAQPHGCTLLLARDQHGEKPLYLHATSTSLTFASSASAVIAASHQIGPTPPRPNPTSLASWLAFGWDIHTTAHPNTTPPPLNQLVEVPPATILTWNNVLHPSAHSLICPLDPPASPRPLNLNLTHLLHHAVASRMEADVNLGCFLSGGIDSSLVAAYAQKALNPSTRLRTFCLQMPDPRFDEAPFAQAIAKHLGTQHTTLSCSPNAAEDLIRLIAQIGLPFADSSLLPTYWLAAASRHHVKVALSGDGGDELFCGYRRHSVADHLRTYGFLWKLLPESLATRLSGTGFNSIARVISAAHAGYSQLPAILLRSQAAALIGPLGNSPFAAAPLSDQHANAWDLKHYLPGDLMRKVDSASMSVGLEVRAPFLEPALVRAAAHTPLALHMRNAQPKALLRELAFSLFPSKILDRPKQGFAIPLDLWFRSDFGNLRTLLLDTLASKDPFPANVLGFEINRRFVQRLVDEHMQGRRNHGQRMYTLLVLAVWAAWFKTTFTSTAR